MGSSSSTDATATDNTITDCSNATNAAIAGWVMCCSCSCCCLIILIILILFSSGMISM